MKPPSLQKLFFTKAYRDDFWLSLFVTSYFFVESLNMSIKQLLPVSAAVWKIMSLGFMGLLGVLLLLSIGTMLKREGVAFLCTEAIFLSLYLISLLMGNASTLHLLQVGFWTLGVCLPLAFYVRAIRDKQILLDILRKAGYVQGVLLWATLYHMNATSTYSMSASYALLIPLLVCLSRFFTEKRICDLVFAAISALMIVLFGARGPLLCVAFYVLLQVCFLMKRGALKYTLLSVGALGIGVFAFARAWLIQVLTALMLRFGVYSRTLVQLINGHISSTSGRDDLFSYYWGLIQKNPLAGWGLLGGWLAPGSGPHNMLLEFLLAFGIIIGGLACIFAICLLFRVFFVPCGPLRELIAIFAACNFSKYIIAGFFLQSPEFFLFVILCFSTQSRLFTCLRQKNTLLHRKDHKL